MLSGGIAMKWLRWLLDTEIVSQETSARIARALHLKAVGRAYLLAMRVLLVLVAIGFVWLHIGGPRSHEFEQDPVAYYDRLYAAAGENAAPYYEAAAEIFVDDHNCRWGVEDLFSDAWDEYTWAEAANWLELNQACVDLLLKATSVEPCRFRVVLDDKIGWLCTRPPSTAYRGMAHLLAVDARVACERWGLDAYAARVVAIDTMGRHRMEQHGVIDALSGMVLVSFAHDLAVAPLARGMVPVERLSSYARELASVLRPLPTMRAAYEGDYRDSGWLLGGSIPEGIEGWWVAVMMPPARIQGERARRRDTWVRWGELPPEQQFDPANATYQLLLKRKDFEPSRWNPLNWMSLLIFDMLDVSFLRAQKFWVQAVTRQRASGLILAAHEHRAETGSWPLRLDELGYRTEPALVTDPFSGKLFCYRTMGEGFILYSAGVDRDDDGGRHSRSWGRYPPDDVDDENWQPDGDYVFWPVQW